MKKQKIANASADSPESDGSKSNKRKPPVRKRQGALQAFPKMPLDILYEVS